VLSRNILSDLARKWKFSQNGFGDEKFSRIILIIKILRENEGNNFGSGARFERATI